jgi:pyruvate,water dikinase
VAGLHAYTPDELAADPDAQIGGKAAGLLHIRAAGLLTPPFRVLPVHMVRERPWRGARAREALQELFEELARPPFRGLAVRSSAAVEDRAGASCAGVFETRFVDRAEELPDALDAVTDAADSPRARALVRGGAAPDMAIVVQAAVTPEVAGVLFSAHPAAARPDEAYVEMVRGPGGGLVDGSKTPARAWLAVADGMVARFEAGTDGPAGLAAACAGELMRCLLALEQRMDAALDIEFAIAEGRVWLLQARPMTALRADPALRPSRCMTSWFFDQRFTEPIYPVTRGTLLPLIVRAALGEALAMRGRPLPDDALEFHGGQAYVAHAVYHGMFSGAPRWLMTHDLRQLFPEQCACTAPPRRDRLRYFTAAAAALFRHFGDALLNLPRWARFQRALPERLAEIGIPPAEDAAAWRRAWDALDALTLAFLRLHRWSLLWADYGYRIYRCLLRCMPAAAARYVGRRLQGETRLVTREANAARARCLRGELSLNDFVRAYGHRSDSLDYAVPTWGELAEADQLPAIASADPAKPRARRGPLSLPLWPLRRALEMREEQRFAWERILARQRAMLIDAARLLAGRGVLTREEDIWFLAWDEVSALLEGRMAPPVGAVARRRHARRLESLTPKPSFLGPAELPPTESAPTEWRGTGASAGMATGPAAVLTGTPGACAPPEGCIAVMPALDPAWSVILPRVAGLVLERGGLLSHGAILAREYGVPLVIGVPDAAARIPEGATITVDGGRGIVRLDHSHG